VLKNTRGFIYLLDIFHRLWVLSRVLMNDWLLRLEFIATQILRNSFETRAVYFVISIYGVEECSDNNVLVQVYMLFFVYLILIKDMHQTNSFNNF